MLIPNIKPISIKRLEQLKRDAGNSKYREWRKYIIKRDGNKCQYPGCKEEDGLQVHHIKKFSKFKHLKIDKLNGITLCEKCHRKIYNKEEMYEILFIRIVIDNEKRSKDKNN